MTTVPIGRLLARVLAGAGVQGVYGQPLSGMAITWVGDPEVAHVMSVAHRAVHGIAAAAHLGGGVLQISGTTASTTKFYLSFKNHIKR